MFLVPDLGGALPDSCQYVYVFLVKGSPKLGTAPVWSPKCQREGRTISLNLLITLLTQPRVWLDFLATRTPCWLTFFNLSNNTIESFSAKLLYKQAVHICNVAWHFSLPLHLLHFTMVLSAHCNSLSGPSERQCCPLAYRSLSPVWHCQQTWNMPQAVTVVNICRKGGDWWTNTWLYSVYQLSSILWESNIKLYT